MTKRLPGMSVPRVMLYPALLLQLAAPSALLAAESVSTEEWEISADKLTRYDEPASIVAEGNIVLIKRRQLPPQREAKELEGSRWSELLEEKTVAPEPTQAEIEEDQEPVIETQVTIKADWAVYDTALNTIHARGHVSVVTEDEQLYAEQGKVNLEQETGTFKQATIIRKQHELHLEGETIEKTGHKTYHIENGWVVTCKLEDGETAPWSFAASEADIEQDGYAFMTNARFRIKDVPILYSPWMVIPAKNKRETGFLLPELISSDNGGAGFNLPFFWNISDSTDLTFYSQYYSKRGYMPGLEFRYISSETDKGVIMGSYLNDDLSDPSETSYYADTGFTHDNKDRYWVRGKADQELNDWTMRLDIDIVSDRDYLTEFNSGVTGFNDTNERFLDVFGRSFEDKTDDQRTNTLGLLKSWDNSSLIFELLAVNDVRSNKIGNSPLWNLPSLEYTGTLPLESFGDFTLSWDSSYYNFWREEGTGAHRIDLHPTLSTSVPLSQYLESRAEVGVRETFYSIQSYGDSEWTKDSTQNRFLYDVSAEVGTTLMRTFALDEAEGTALAHQIRPYVEYSFIPDVDQEDQPYFDDVDHIGETNSITYGVDNFLNLMNDGTDEREYAHLKINQSYSLLDDDSDEPLSEIEVRFGVQPISSLNFDYRTYFDVYGDGFTSHSFEGYYSNDRGDYFSIQYVYDDDGNTEQVNTTISTLLLPSIRLEADVEHSMSEGETNEADVSLIYLAPCWSLELATQYTPSDTAFMLVFNLANIGTGIGFSY